VLASVSGHLRLRSDQRRQKRPKSAGALIARAPADFLRARLHA
jgi:hypothetical protein